MAEREHQCGTQTIQDTAFDRAPQRRFARSRYLLLTLISIVSVAAYASRWTTPREVTFDATIVSIDRPNAVATLAFVHPRSGDTMEMTVALDPQCQVFIRGQLKTLTALQPQDPVSMTARVYRLGRIRATRFSVQSRTGAREGGAEAEPDVTGRP